MLLPAVDDLGKENLWGAAAGIGPHGIKVFEPLPADELNAAAGHLMIWMLCRISRITFPAKARFSRIS